MRTWRGIVFGGAALVGVFGAGAGRSSAQVSPDSIRPLALDSVVVEVLRTPVVLGDAPFSISVLGRAELARGKSGASLEEALQGLPGVEVQNRFNYAVGEQVSIRGFGARAQFGLRGSEAVVDGIPATLPDGQSTLDHVAIGSLGRVEALRGPASAVWGNAAGGVLLFRSRPPPLAPFREEAEVVLGSDGLRRYQSTTGGTLGSTGYLLSLSRLGWDGFRTDPLGSGTYGAATRHHLNGFLTTEAAGGELRLTLNGLDLDAENPGSISDSVLALGDRRAHAFNVTQRTGKQVRQGQVGLAWRGDAGGLGLDLAGWGIRRSLENPIPPTIVELERRAGGLRATVSSSRDPAGLEWSLGAEAQLQRDDRSNFENDAGRRGTLTLDQDEAVTGVAAFGQAGVGLGSRVDLTAGLRYDRIRFRVTDRLTTNDPDDSGERTLDAWSPSVGLHLELLPWVSAYGNVATFFETPTTTELANRPSGAGGFNPGLEPERGVTVEAGVRGRTEGGVAFEVAAFRTGLDDELVPFEVADSPGRTFFRNAGSSTRTGVELLAWAPLGPHLTGQLTYTGVRARFDRFTADGVDLGGKRIPGLAPNRIEALLTATWNGGFAELRSEYTDAVPADDANTAATAAHWLLDLRMGADPVRRSGLSVEPWAGITNLLDERYSASVTVNAFGGRYFEPGPGRSFYLGARIGFSGT